MVRLLIVNCSDLCSVHRDIEVFSFTGFFVYGEARGLTCAKNGGIVMRWILITVLLVSVIAAALAWANYHESPLPADVEADRVVVDKAKRQLLLYSDGQLLKRYRVSLGRVPVGAKAREGDKKTPEGQYLIDFRKADSAYYRALHISYPSVADVEAARKMGVPPGNAIMIHGIRNGLGWAGRLHRFADWTAGCIAVTNQEMAELWRAIPDGTPIELKP